MTNLFEILICVSFDFIQFTLKFNPFRCSSNISSPQSSSPWWNVMAVNNWISYYCQLSRYGGTTSVSFKPCQFFFENKFWSQINEEICNFSICILNLAIHTQIAWFMVSTTTFDNNSVISQRSVLLAEETGVPGENHRPVTKRRYLIQCAQHVSGITFIIHAFTLIIKIIEQFFEPRNQAA